MKHIKTFDYRDTLKDQVINRVAVRGVIKKNDLFLMIYLTQSNEYKFPGGGVEENETLLDCLTREVLEESGYSISKVIKEIGYIDQFHNDIYEHDKDFTMRSIYYECEVSDTYFELCLDGYELELGFKPVWVRLDDAIKVNEKKLEIGSEYHWTERELFMLKYLKKA